MVLEPTNHIEKLVNDIVAYREKAMVDEPSRTYCIRLPASIIGWLCQVASNTGQAGGTLPFVPLADIRVVDSDGIDFDIVP
jgi:hypothetical protein